MLVHAVPLAHYNRIVPFGGSDAANMEELAGFYIARQTPCRVDVNPDLATAGQIRDLERTGFQPAEFQSNLWGCPRAIDLASPPQITVDEVAPKELHFFANFFNRAYYQGRKVPRRLMRFRADTIVARYGRPGWRLYLCRVCDIPAAGGVLFVGDGVGTLAGAATMARFRGRGCQRALLQRRAADAAAMGCDLLAARCGVGSVSQRNMERAGLQTAYTKVIWGPARAGRRAHGDRWQGSARFRAVSRASDAGAGARAHHRRLTLRRCRWRLTAFRGSPRRSGRAW